jgi:N-methylhydantoinase B
MSSGNHWDPVLTEVLANVFGAISEEMAYVIHRTSHTAFIKETNDFAAALFTPDGEIFSYPRTTGVAVFLGLNLQKAINCVERCRAGDIFITNDPYETGGLATHLPDIHLFMPILHDGQIVCFAWAFLHSSDIGGRVPSSVSATNSEIFQEGLRIPPVHLYRQGCLNDELLRVYFANVRVPEQNWGDIKAMVAALKLAERRVERAVEKYGLREVRAYQQLVLEFAEAKARRVVAELPKGTYRFTDYLDDDNVSDVPVRLSLTATVNDGVELDFTGTDPQVASAFNIPTAGANHPWICNGLVTFFLTRDPTIPLNAGVLRPVSVKLPTGTIVNPQFPAAVGVRQSTAFRIFDMVLGVLAQAAPTIAPAPGAGQGCMPSIAIHDGPTGERRIAILEPIIGGTGGRPDRDGVDGTDMQFITFRNVPVEMQEAELPILVHTYGFVRDTAGPGTFRGGAAVRMDVELRKGVADVVVRGMERFRFAPWGVHGGLPGKTGSCILNPGTKGERDLGRFDAITIRAGDVIRFISPSGAGYGDPLARAEAAVAEDMRRGYISAEAARTIYGVALDVDGRINQEETATLRANATQSNRMFAFCDARLSYEQLWTDDGFAALSELLSSVPVRLRHDMKTQVIGSLLREPGSPGCLCAKQIRMVWRALMQPRLAGDEVIQAAMQVGTQGPATSAVSTFEGLVPSGGVQ